MKKHLYILTTFLISLPVCGQKTDEKLSVSFDSIISKFEEHSGWDPFIVQTNDSVTSSSLLRTEDFNVSISENPINFETTHVTFLHNPFYTEDYEDYEDRIINYPISYSVIYDQKLITLFRNGKFVCHNLENYIRDENYEKQLNTKKFKQHWVLDGNLYAQSKSKLFRKFYLWNGNEWVKSNTKLPIDDQPILFDDEEFIVFSDCNGEWGGTIYFYDRASKNIYFTESTCTNTVTKNDNKFKVLAHSGHMAGTFEIKIIEDPRKLPVAKKREIGQIKDWGNSGYNENPEGDKMQLDLFGIQAFSTFQYKGRQLFIMHLNEITFLAEINGKEIEIVHPFFNDDKYTHNPITKTYGEYQLINLDHYGIAFDREVSVIVIKENKITLLDWNKNNSH